jgi:hypothetical protein
VSKGGDNLSHPFALPFEAAEERNGKQRLRDEGSQLVTNCHQLKLPASDGRMAQIRPT